MEKSKIGIEVIPTYGFHTYTSHSPNDVDKDKIVRLTTWFFWKNKPYPLNHIGNGAISVSKNLGISLFDAQLLVIEKLEEILPTIENKVLKLAVERKLEAKRQELNRRR